MKIYPKRKKMRWENYDYTGRGYYYITIVTKNRNKILSYVVDGEIVLKDIGEIVQESILYLKMENIDIPVYIIMPNHIHMIVGDMDSKDLIIKIMDRFKGYTGYISKKRYGIDLWQRSYYEKIIRSDIQYRAVMKYIIENPIKWEMDKYNR